MAEYTLPAIYVTRKSSENEMSRKESSNAVPGQSKEQPCFGSHLDFHSVAPSSPCMLHLGQVRPRWIGRGKRDSSSVIGHSLARRRARQQLLASDIMANQGDHGESGKGRQKRSQTSKVLYCTRTECIFLIGFLLPLCCFWLPRSRSQRRKNEKLPFVPYSELRAD